MLCFPQGPHACRGLAAGLPQRPLCRCSEGCAGRESTSWKHIHCSLALVWVQTRHQGLGWTQGRQGVPGMPTTATQPPELGWRHPQSPQPSSLQLRPQTLEQNPYCAQQEFLTHGIYKCKKSVFLLPLSLGRWFICHTATVP